MEKHSKTNSIIIIDDNPEIRLSTIINLAKIIPKGWDIVAPTNLYDAIELIEDDTRIKIAIIDNNLNSNGFQEMKSDGDYRDYRGWQLAQNIASKQDTRIISYSISGGIYMTNSTPYHFKRKLEILNGNEDAIKELQELVRSLIAQTKKS
ncbi:hypothetical protein COU74_03845 [Candidatus Peregrinibacteria bacterium CG10_big_fil_rev_8_21_14_0_10_36_19]|nr:MAG: hypothetical protein COU74_03845 [Candidatus Peregrinibacteria bacterium CG10_big_fil_rev_8_21_14_0_10_36_19]